MKRFTVFCFVCLLMPLVVFALPKRELAQKTAKQVSIEKEMVEVARRGNESATAMYRGGKLELDSVLDFSTRLLEAELQQATTISGRLAAIDAGIERATWLERSTQEKVQGGLETVSAHSAAKYHLLKLMRLREQENTVQ